MRILHTADWHLGRAFEGFGLEADFAAVLEQVGRAVKTHAPDVLIIAGDIFDRAAPSETAVRQFNVFIRRIAETTRTAIVLIAGNHDSGERIGAMAMLADEQRALVRGPLSADERPLILSDSHGPVAISGLPFGYEFTARECFGDDAIKTPEDVMRAQVAAARRHVPAGARWVIVAHAFVTGAVASDVERPLSRAVGGIDTVPADVFDGAHYVALGHLHKPQSVCAPHIRYSGSPLAFGFDEEGVEKSMTLVELGPDGAVEIELIPFTPLRQVRTLRGTLAELTDSARAQRSEDFVRIILTDEGRLVDPMKRIRERYPNACMLSYDRAADVPKPSLARAGATALDDPQRLVAEFLSFSRGTEPSEAEARLIASALAGIGSGVEADNPARKDMAA